jgi:dGTP triphosphohydrolase
MLPVYDPKSFASIDLRKYHIRDINDVIKFHEFVASRMEEAQFILKKFNTQLATFKAVSSQLKAKQTQQQAAYGAGIQAQQEPTKPAEIQTVDKSVEEAHNALLDDIRAAAAEETLAEEIDSDEPLEAILGKYKMVYGKKGPMFYRENEDGRRVLVSKKDVPEDIKQQLLASVGKEE